MGGTREEARLLVDVRDFEERVKAMLRDLLRALDAAERAYEQLRDDLDEMRYTEQENREEAARDAWRQEGLPLDPREHP